MTAPKFEIGNIVTEPSVSYALYFYNVEEIIKSGGQYSYLCAPIKGCPSASTFWKKEDALQLATPVAPVLPTASPVKQLAPTPKPMRVCDAICLETVLSGESSVIVDVDGTPTVEYRYRPLGAVRGLYMRSLDLGKNRRRWYSFLPTDLGMTAHCRVVPYVEDAPPAPVS